MMQNPLLPVMADQAVLVAICRLSALRLMHE
jgi:hypothetical protein